jgi:hypothetical protein
MKTSIVIPTSARRAPLVYAAPALTFPVIGVQLSPQLDRSIIGCSLVLGGRLGRCREIKLGHRVAA